MSESSKKNDNTSAILNGFKDMLTAHQKSSDRRGEQERAINESRHSENSVMMKELTNAVTNLTLITAETKKDNKHDRATISRLENNQISTGVKVGELSKDVLELKINQKNILKKDDKKGDAIYRVITGLSIASIVAFLAMFGGQKNMKQSTEEGIKVHTHEEGGSGA